MKSNKSAPPSQPQLSEEKTIVEYMIEVSSESDIETPL
jgi:hypothetical protein